MKAGRPETHVRSGEHVHLIWVWSQNLVGTCQVQIPFSNNWTFNVLCSTFPGDELLPETFILSVQSLDHRVEHV